jgi:hypothetical protein
VVALAALLEQVQDQARANTEAVAPDQERATSIPLVTTQLQVSKEDKPVIKQKMLTTNKL